MRTIGIDIRLIGKQRTGDEVVFFNLTKEVLKIDEENTYRLYTDETDPLKLATLQGQLECVGNPRVTFVTLGAKNRFLWNLLSLPWSLIRHPVDVYHTQYIAPLWIPKKTKLVTHIHDVSFAAHPEWIAFRDRAFLRLLLPRSLRRSAILIVPSRFTRDEVIKYFQIAEDRIIVVENALADHWQARPSDEEVVKVRHKFNVPEAYFISVGTMQPRKNVASLIAAFESFQIEHPGISLVLVGNVLGKHIEPSVYQAYREKRPGIIFTGYVNEKELKALICGSAGFFFPSLYEGFGIPLLEAFAMGAPVGASDISIFHEIAGEAAFYYDAVSLAEMKKIMYTFYIEKDKILPLRERGMEQLQRYSWRKSAHKLRDLYASI